MAHFPIDVMSADDASGYRAQLEKLEFESQGMKLGNNAQLNYPHVIYRFANSIARNNIPLDAVAAVIGPNIMLWGSTFFIKEPHTENYVSWHQDLRYWGLQIKKALVSAWLVLAPVSKANGCMQFIPGSHKGELVQHRDSYDNQNVLTRGQHADVEIDENAIIHVELEPGQASLHHGYLLHASAPNNSDNRRIGYTMNFITPDNRQTVATRDYAMLIHGEDNYGYFDQVPPPENDLGEEAIAWHRRILHSQNEAMYDGATVER